MRLANKEAVSLIRTEKNLQVELDTNTNRIKPAVLNSQNCYIEPTWRDCFPREPRGDMYFPVLENPRIIEDRYNNQQSYLIERLIDMLNQLLRANSIRSSFPNFNNLRPKIRKFPNFNNLRPKTPRPGNQDQLLVNFNKPTKPHLSQAASLKP